MDTPKPAQIRSQGGAGPFAGITMHLALPIAIVIPRPLVCSMAHRPVFRMTSGIAIGLVSVEHRAAHRDVLINQLMAGALIRVLTHPKSVFPALARDQMNDRRSIV